MTHRPQLLVFVFLTGCAGAGDPGVAEAPRSPQGADSTPAAGPLKSSQGPLTMRARLIRVRGTDRVGSEDAKTEIRIENNLRIDEICDIRITRDGTWSNNQLLTKSCLPPSSATIVIPPEGGEWTIKVETNLGKTQVGMVEVGDVPVGVSFED